MTECSEAVGVRRADVVHKLVIYLDFSTRSSLRFTGRFGKRKYSASGISWWLLRAQWKATAAQLLQLRCKEDMWNLEGYRTEDHIVQEAEAAGSPKLNDRRPEKHFLVSQFLLWLFHGVVKTGNEDPSDLVSAVQAAAGVILWFWNTM